MRSRRHSGSREKGTDLGEKNTGEGGAQVELVQPVAQRDCRRTARVEDQRLRCAQGRGPRRTRESRRHAQAPARRVPRGVRCAGRGGHVLRPLLQAMQAVHGQWESREQGRPQGGQEREGRLVRSYHAPRRPSGYQGNGFTSNLVTVK